MAGVSGITHSSSYRDSLTVKFSHMCNVAEPNIWLNCVDFISFFFISVPIWNIVFLTYHGPHYWAEREENFRLPLPINCHLILQVSLNTLFCALDIGCVKWAVASGEEGLDEIVSPWLQIPLLCYGFTHVDPQPSFWTKAPSIQSSIPQIAQGQYAKLSWAS